MRIGILTLPLHTNYGGILQAYALLTVLRRLGHQPYLIKDDKRSYLRYRCFRTVCNINRFLIRKNQKLDLLYLIHKLGAPLLRTNSSSGKAVSSKLELICFIHKYMSPLLRIDFSSDKSISSNLEKHKINYIIVGSDQVWRPEYAQPIERYFLNFLPQDSSIRSAAYAASFGVNDWRFTEHQTKNCAELIKRFEAISVREDSGLKLCKQYLNRDASQVLDPTLLLDKEAYIKVINQEKEKPCQGDLFYYILDMTPQKQALVTDSATKMSMQPFGLTLEGQQGKYPSITAWLRCFMDAKYVITDSFHGCVFSIIFNKPFWVIVNSDRGAARFSSLLKLFGLEDRMLPDSFNYLSDFNFTQTIDWDSVNARKKEWQQKSLDYLQTSLEIK